MSEPEEAFAYDLRVSGYEFVREFVFHRERKFRLDFANPSRKIGLEINGGTWGKMGHSSPSGIRRDYEKFNLAQLDGWLLLICTPEQVTNGEALQLWEQASQLRDGYGEMEY